MQLPLFELPTLIQPSVPRLPADRYSSARDGWQTPQHIVKPVLDVLGAIDLDPCSDSNTILNIPARKRFSIVDNSLMQPWAGRLWLNPPFTRAIGSWINKLCDEYEHGGITAALTLIPARTDAPWWDRLSRYPYCAIKGQITFVSWDKRRKTNPSYTSAVVYLGPQLSRFSTVFSALGTVYIPYSD